MLIDAQNQVFSYFCRPNGTYKETIPLFSCLNCCYSWLYSHRNGFSKKPEQVSIFGANCTPRTLSLDVFQEENICLSPLHKNFSHRCLLVTTCLISRCNDCCCPLSCFRMEPGFQDNSFWIYLCHLCLKIDSCSYFVVLQIFKQF